MHLVGREASRELLHELAKALGAFADRDRQRAVEFAVQKELPVLGIEAHGVGRQHIDGKIGREPRNVFAVGLGKMARGIVFYELSTLAMGNGELGNNGSTCYSPFGIRR